MFISLFALQMSQNLFFLNYELKMTNYDFLAHRYFGIAQHK